VKGYVVSQAVGWLLVTGLVAMLVHTYGLPAWIWAAVPVVLVKDVLVMVAMRRVSGPPKAGPEALIGARGESVEPVAPAGYVRVRGELWRAETRHPAGRAIPAGRPVVVRQVRGLTLVVDEATRAPDDQSTASGE
jgi:membrane protein implicated in regulation of membrane protease activity